MKDNLLYHGEEDEPRIVNTIRNVLNRLSPSDRETFFDELTGSSVSTKIMREEETDTNAPSDTVLVGLARDPKPVSLDDLPAKSGAGPIDLYAEDNDRAIAVEVKLGDTLSHSQLGRYATALDANELVIVTWSDVYRAFQTLRDSANPEYQLLIDESLDYLSELGLHQDAVTFDHYWGEQEGYKYVRAIPEKIIFYSNDIGERGKNDRRELSWEQFRRLFKDIEDRHSKELTQKIFIDVEPLSEVLNSHTILGEINSVRTDDNLLRLFYHGDDQELKLREVQAGDESPPAPGKPAGFSEQYTWLMNEHDQQSMLNSHSDNVREQIFIQREWTDSLAD